MAIYFAIPSKRPPKEVELRLSRWREMGYRLALWRDPGDDLIGCDLLLSGAYPGYALALNSLSAAVFALDGEAQWIVTGGDDIEPEAAKRAEEIAAECSEHFNGTFGVMQPTGDRWGHREHVYAEHVCGSPFLGREFCRRMYGGRGPLHPGYEHFYEDEELQQVAVMLGVLWQRSDLTHYHHHYMRERQARPAFMRDADRVFSEGQRMFQARKLAGFPGHAPIP